MKQRQVLKDDEMFYVPLLDSLQVLLNKPSILNQVSESLMSVCFALFCHKSNNILNMLS